MHECVAVLTKVLDAKCKDVGGLVVVDMNRVLSNLTAVSP